MNLVYLTFKYELITADILPNVENGGTAMWKMNGDGSSTRDAPANVPFNQSEGKHDHVEWKW